MTLIENDSPKVQYTGPFIKGQLLPLTFPYIATEDVKMIIDDKPAIFNVDYEIITEPNDEHPVAYPNSAYIKSDLPDAKQITLYRVTPLDQQAPFPQQSKFRSERVEQALDKLTMQQQEQEEQLSRCIIAPITLETFNGQLPAPAADQALKWNTEGTELENYDIIGEQEAFETDVNTRFEEQSIAIENRIGQFEEETNTRIGQFEEETNTQFSEFRNEISENLEAVLNAADKLETLEQQVQVATDAASTALNSATKADEYAEEAFMSADQAEDTLEEIKQVVQDAEDAISEIMQNCGLPMFSPQWSDHLYKDASFLRADNFSWHSADIYVTAYEEILRQYNNPEATEQTDGDIIYKLSPDGFRIALASEHDKVLERYLEGEKAWFYILDSENQRFKLPREKKTDGKYLYFYVGTYERSETEVDLGTVTDQLSDKIDADGGNFAGSGLEKVFNERGSRMTMFDTILKDHILTYEESKGLALQGTYVYKEAVAGSRYGYVDFYNKCLEEYQNSSNTKQWLKSNVTMVGSVVDNEGVLSGFTQSTYAQIAESLPLSTVTSWDWVFAFTYATSTTKQVIISEYNANNASRIVCVDDVLCADMSTSRTSFNIGSIVGKTTLISGVKYFAKLSFTGSQYNLYLSMSGKFEGEESLEGTVASSTKVLDNTYAIGEDGLSNTTYPFLGSIDLNESYININGERWWKGTDTVLKNPNGHIFYDIADKQLIDDIFNSTGMAWMYGIDQENERVFLPRNSWFEQAGDITEVGLGVEAGLPNITGYLGDLYSWGTGVVPTGAFAGSLQQTANLTVSGSAVKFGNAKFDASKSNPIYNNSDTVQPNAVKKLLYICVGNTVADTSWVDVVAQVEGGVKEIEEAKDEAVDAMKSAIGGTVPLGFIGAAVLGIDETLNLQRYLNGQIILQNQFKGFTKFLKRRVELYPSLACAEDEWQTEVTMSAFSQCGKFVIDDNAGTIRLPKVVNIQGLTDLSKLGEIVEAGLPNITGSLSSARLNQGDLNKQYASGAFSWATTSNMEASASSTANTGQGFNFDASLSNPIYNNSNTVQQEQIQYPYFIQVATGAETEDNIINEIELNNPFFFGMSQYFESEPNNISWLKSAGQWNAKAVYTDYYDWLLKIYNGVEVVEGVSVKLSTEEYTDYDYVLNTAEETFRLPLLDGSESLQGERYVDLPIQNNTEYIAEANGHVLLTAQNKGYIALFTAGTWVYNQQPADSNNYYSVLIPVKKGSVFKASIYNTTVQFCHFIYAQGNGSLYYYVGETVQNANLINAGRIEEKIAALIPDNSSLIAGYGMPSDRYIDLTLGASGTTYTAPATGWVTLVKNAGSSQTNGNILVAVGACEWRTFCTLTGTSAHISVPVAKGQSFKITYNLSGTTTFFRFIYAEGDQ